MSIGLSAYNFKGTELNIDGSSNNVEIWVVQDSWLRKPKISWINSTLTIPKEYETIYFYQSVANGLISINLHPKSNKTISYLILINFLYDNQLDSNVFDLSKVLCYTGQNETLSFWFRNNKTIEYRGTVVIRIRELNEFKNECPSDNISLIENPAKRNKITFSVDLEYYIFNVGCYFFDKTNFKWSSDGMETMNDSNYRFVHCKSKKLGLFAGGYSDKIVSIEFKEPTVVKSLGVVIFCGIIGVSFIFLSFWTIYMDKQDLDKTGITNLEDNEIDDIYKYKITIFTGTKANSQTDSNVIIAIYGDKNEIKARPLIDSSRKLFRRGGIDCFILTTKQSIGTIDYIKIWHDNTGRGDSASWYLNYIILHDLQTNQKLYFLCHKWLAVDKDDFKIERILTPVGSIKKSDILYLIKEQTINSFNDGHLFISIFNKPLFNGFTRLERAVCFYLALFSTFFLDAVYMESNDVINRPEKIILMFGDIEVLQENVR